VAEGWRHLRGGLPRTDPHDERVGAIQLAGAGDASVYRGRPRRVVCQQHGRVADRADVLVLADEVVVTEVRAERHPQRGGQPVSLHQRLPVVQSDLDRERPHRAEGGGEHQAARQT
jgi:hypothetical protein